MSDGSRARKIAMFGRGRHSTARSYSISVIERVSPSGT